jgi:hypothetical protein
MQTFILDVLNHPRNKVQPQELALLQKIERLSPELRTLMSNPRHADQLRKMKQWADKLGNQPSAS